VFVLVNLFQPNLIFVGEAKSLPYMEAIERHFIWVGSSLTRKQSNLPETYTLAYLKNSSTTHVKSFITLAAELFKLSFNSLSYLNTSLSLRYFTKKDGRIPTHVEPDRDTVPSVNTQKKHYNFLFVGWFVMAQRSSK
jgi:hypothetical protein